MYQKAIIFFGVLGALISVILGLLSFIRWEIVGALVTVSLGIIPALLAYEKTTSKPRAKQEGEENKQEQQIVEEKVILRDESISIKRDFAEYFEFEFEFADNMNGEISSDSPIDIYFVDNANFDKWDKGRRKFDSEYCAESVLETKIDYEIPKKGIWYLIIENNGRKTALVKIYLHYSILSDDSKSELFEHQ